MIQIKQEELQKALLLYYNQQLHEVLEEAFRMEQKYGISFELFEAKLDEFESDEFEIEDDYIDWKAARGFAKTYDKYIKHIEDGFFEIIE